MKNLIYAEYLKLRTTRSTWALAGAMLAATGFATAVNAGAASARTAAEALSALLTGGAFAGWIFALCFGIQIFAAEWRYGTAITTFTGTPRRGRVLAAKLAAAAAAGCFLGITTAVMTLAAGLPVLAHRHLTVGLPTGSLAGACAGVAATVAAYALIGTALAALIRHQALVVVTGIIWTLVAETTLAQAAPGIGRYLPTAAAFAAEHVTSYGHARVLTPAAGYALLAGYVMVVSAAAWQATCRRDIA
jgi:ABC-2 type transport system permease protein